MKKNFFKMAFVSLFVVVALSSCKKDDDDGVNDTGSVIVNNTITANFGSSYDGKIDVVKAELFYESGSYGSGSYDYGYYVVAEAPYSNGGFTLQLPATVSDTYLYVISEDVPDGITISNPNVKVVDVGIYAYKADEETGSFYYGSSDEDVYGELYYANGDVSITGSYTENYDGDEYTETWNAHLKRGWNILYEIETSDDVYEEITTKAPAGVKWRYYSYDSRSSAQGVSAKKTPALFGKSSIRGLNKN